MNFVNCFGERIVIGSRASHQPKKRPPKEKPEKSHEGWSVVGFSPESLLKAEKEHDLAQREKGENKPFDAEAYMNGRKPQKGRRAAFQIPESAGLFAELLKKQGWSRVAVVELIKGGA